MFNNCKSAARLRKKSWIIASLKSFIVGSILQTNVSRLKYFPKNSEKSNDIYYTLRIYYWNIQNYVNILIYKYIWIKDTDKLF